ncbi:MAG: 2-amino-4-hydroxy-6-hydroxymethyldihydropteridine diphosphokinase [bacterium JZ-2024 1]
MARVWIGVGSNLGDRKAYLVEAVECLQNYARVLRRSSIYLTSPWGYSAQPDFLNAVVEIETTYEPQELLRILKEIEREMGRKPGEKWHPRVIDLDILLYEDRIVKTEELTIPHPLLSERLFVLVPLSEIIPEKEHPVIGKTIEQLRREKEGNAGGERVEKTHHTW